MTPLPDIEKLVAKVAKAALQDSTSDQDRVDALKVLTPYYLSLKKERNVEESETSTMHDLAQAFQDPENNAQVRSRRRPQ